MRFEFYVCEGWRLDLEAHLESEHPDYEYGQGFAPMVEDREDGTKVCPVCKEVFFPDQLG